MNHSSTPKPGFTRWNTAVLTYSVLIILSILMYRQELHLLVQLSLRDERYTHVILVPVISLGMMWYRQTSIFREFRPSPIAGAVSLLLLGALHVGVYLYGQSLPATMALPMAIGELIWIWISAFLLLFGLDTLRRAYFSAVLLLLFIPLPEDVVSTIQSTLQYASADATEGIFRLTGTPVFRDGLRFSLPGVLIEVAPECSGIRSSFALLISSMVLGHLFLRTAKTQVILLFLALPLLVIKNAIRIATLSWLGAYVSKDFLTGELHHSGGMVFFALAIALLVPLLLVLHRFERVPKPLSGGSLGESSLS